MQSNAIESVKQVEQAAAQMLRSARAEAENIGTRALEAAKLDRARRVEDAANAAKREIEGARVAAEDAARQAKRIQEDKLRALRVSVAERKPAAIEEILRLIRE